MKSKRVIATIALLVGLAIGLLGRPLLGPGTAEAAQGSKTSTYTCSTGGLNNEVWVLNLTTKQAHVTEFKDDQVLGTTTLPSHGFTSFAPNGAFFARVRSDRALLVGGNVHYSAGAGDTQTWGIPCK